MRPLIVGIAGGSGSGKTTVAQNIAEGLPKEHVVLVEHDAYYRDLHHVPLHERNYDHPASLDNTLLLQHLQQLRAGVAVDTPVYDFVTHRREPFTRRVVPKHVIIVDGILVLQDEGLRDLMDIKLYVDTDADERLLRRIERDLLERGRSLAEIHDQYLRTVKPMHREFVEPSKRWADVIIPEGGSNRVALDIVLSKLRGALPAVGMTPKGYGAGGPLKLAGIQAV